MKISMYTCISFRHRSEQSVPSNAGAAIYCSALEDDSQRTRCVQQAVRYGGPVGADATATVRVRRSLRRTSGAADPAACGAAAGRSCLRATSCFHELRAALRRAIRRGSVVLWIRGPNATTAFAAAIPIPAATSLLTLAETRTRTRSLWQRITFFARFFMSSPARFVVAARLVRYPIPTLHDSSSYTSSVMSFNFLRFFS